MSSTARAWKADKMNTSPKAVEDVLGGDKERLAEAFSWSNTPQGRDFWSDELDSGGPLSKKARSYLEGLLKANGDSS